jgi:hypothetical protein
MTMLSSQGMSFGAVEGLTNVKVSRKTGDPVRLDASTLELADGDHRVFVNGLPDAGAAAADGVEATVVVSYLSDSPPSVGDVVDHEGTDYVCTDVDVEYAVGELVKGTATYKTKPPEES